MRRASLFSPQSRPTSFAMTAGKITVTWMVTVHRLKRFLKTAWMVRGRLLAKSRSLGGQQMRRRVISGMVSIGVGSPSSVHG
jgi:hypothetical protein